MKDLLALHEGPAVAEGRRAGHGDDRAVLGQLSLNRDVVLLGERSFSDDDPPPAALEVVDNVLKDPPPDVGFDGRAVDQVGGLGLNDPLDLDGEDAASVGDAMDRSGAVGGAPERPRNALRRQETLEVLVGDETEHPRQVHRLILTFVFVATLLLLVDDELPLEFDRVVVTQ